MSDTARLASLRKQHVELEDKVEKQERSLSVDHLSIVELKKKKLAIKEEIAAIDGRLNKVA